MDPDGAALTTTTSYDKERVDRVTQPNGGWGESAYDAEGRVLVTADAMGHRTRTEYDAAGRVTRSITDPALDPDGNAYAGSGHADLATEYVYDAAGRLVRSKGPDGIWTATEHDAAGRATATVVDPTDTTVPGTELNLRTEMTYYANGQPKETVRDPLGANLITLNEYDQAGRLVKTTAPGGRVTEHEHDEDGRTTRTTVDPGGLGIVTETTYDARGLATGTVVDPAGLAITTGTVYDKAERATRGTDANGNLTITAYDDAGRVERLTDAAANELGFGYDGAGRLTDVTNPRGVITHYVFNAAGEQTETYLDHGGADERLARRATYNADGTVATGEDANGNEWAYLYDSVGRLDTVTLTSAPMPVVFRDDGYDAAGRLSTSANFNGTLTTTYDRAGRTAGVASPQGTVSYAYDALGRRDSMTLPGTGKTVQYGYDPDTGDLASVDDWTSEPAATFAYRDDGRLATVVRGGGTLTTYREYDAAGRLEAVQHDNATGVVARYVYGLDDAGNHEQVTMTGSQYAGCPATPCVEDYGYDALDRLTEVGYPGGGFVSYGYDPNGNRDEVTSGGVTTAYEYDRLDQLTGIGATVDLAYDGNGNRDLSQVSSVTTRDYTWDAMNRLTGATVDAGTVGYGYLADGTRSERTQGSTTTGYVYDRSGMATIVDDGATSYVAGPGMTAEVTSAGVTYPLEDGLGSVRFRADDAGAVVGTTEYDVDGNVTASGGQQGLMGFTGEPYDATSKLVDLRSRWYSPSTGVFLSRDSASPSGSGTAGYNGYRYADGNPASNADPTGHGVADVFWLLAAAFECALFGECRWGPKHGGRRPVGDRLAKGGPTPQPSPALGSQLGWIPIGQLPDFPSIPVAHAITAVAHGGLGQRQRFLDGVLLPTDAHEMAECSFGAPCDMFAPGLFDSPITVNGKTVECAGQSGTSVFGWSFGVLSQPSYYSNCDILNGLINAGILDKVLSQDDIVEASLDPLASCVEMGVPTLSPICGAVWIGGAAYVISAGLLDSLGSHLPWRRALIDTASQNCAGRGAVNFYLSGEEAQSFYQERVGIIRRYSGFTDPSLYTQGDHNRPQGGPQGGYVCGSTG